MSRPHTKRSSGRRLKKPSSAANPQTRERFSTKTENPKLAALKRRHFMKKGQAARIARAEKALRVIDEVGSTFKLDIETMKSLAEDPDLEYL
jgi:hypothetical protein